MLPSALSDSSMNEEQEDLPPDPISCIVNFFNELRKLRESTDGALTEWLAKRQQTIHQLESLAESLHNHHRNATIATNAGAGVATASFGLVLGGFIASFFTLGAGLIVSAVGAGVGAVGGLTMTGSKIAEHVIERTETKEVQSALDEDRNASDILRDKFEELDKFFARNSAFICQQFRENPSFIEGIESGREMFPGLGMNAPHGDQGEETNDAAARVMRTVGAGFTLSASAATASISAGRAVFTSLSTAARAAHIAGFAASAALLPLDIYFLVKSSIELHRGSTSEIVTKIRGDLAELSCPSDKETRELVTQYVKDKFREVLHTLVSPPAGPTSDDVTGSVPPQGIST